jgi:hypothetical protein
MGDLEFIDRLAFLVFLVVSCAVDSNLSSDMLRRG